MIFRPVNLNLINFTSFGQSLYLSGVLFVKSLVGSLVKNVKVKFKVCWQRKKFPSRPPNNISKDEMMANGQKTIDEERRRATFSNQYVYLNVIGIFFAFSRVWSKKNETLSKSDIFQFRKYNSLQKPIFHELAILSDKIFWVKNHLNFEKTQFFENRNYWFYSWN